MQVVTLFYVNTTNHLNCVDWGQSRASNCSLSILPNSTIAPDSRHISAAILVSDKDQRGLLLTYQDSSQRPVILLGFVETPVDPRKWTWQNETGKLIAAQTSDFITNACSIGWSHVISAPDIYFLYCFARSSQNGDPQMAVLEIGFTSPSNLTLALGKSSHLLKGHSC